jgi:NAD(P)-dependent dehydrogenase (short-subunit alcohol dehydrogenase family)
MDSGPGMRTSAVWDAGEAVPADGCPGEKAIQGAEVNKVWLITGANSGFGRAFAEAAVAAGDVVVAAARRPETVVDLVDAYPGQVHAAELDVTDLAAARAVVDDVIAQHGRIDVLVNNAGRSHVGAVEETTAKELRDVFDVLFFGPAELVRSVLPHMRARRSGAIVQISSYGGQMANPGVGAYCAAKFALEGLSEALADEVGPLGIKVLVVEPGWFRTSFLGNTSASGRIADYDATLEALRSMFAVGDGGAPGDPAKAAAAVLAALAAEHTPLRLPLGSDAVDVVLQHAEAVRSEVKQWEQTARATAFDDAPALPSAARWRPQ